MKDTLQKTLMDFNQFLNKQKKPIIIDRGLCGVFALNMYNYLKTLGYSPKIIGLYDYIPIKTNGKFNIPAHYIVQVDKNIVDFNTVFDNLKDYRTNCSHNKYAKAVRVPIKALKEQLDTGRGGGNGWNPDMFKKENIKTINVVFKKVFNNDVTVNNIRLHTSANSR